MWQNCNSQPHNCDVTQLLPSASAMPPWSNLYVNRQQGTSSYKWFCRFSERFAQPHTPAAWHTTLRASFWDQCLQRGRCRFGIWPMAKSHMPKRKWLQRQVALPHLPCIATHPPKVSLTLTATTTPRGLRHRSFYLSAPTAADALCTTLTG